LEIICTITIFFSDLHVLMLTLLAALAVLFAASAAQGVSVGAGVRLGHRESLSCFCCFPPTDIVRLLVAHPQISLSPFHIMLFLWLTSSGINPTVETQSGNIVLKVCC
jgi:hypothetical protein